HTAAVRGDHRRRRAGVPPQGHTGAVTRCARDQRPRPIACEDSYLEMVGAKGFEPSTSTSRTGFGTRRPPTSERGEVPKERRGKPCIADGRTGQLFTGRDRATAVVDPFCCSSAVVEGGN